MSKWTHAPSTSRSPKKGYPGKKARRRAQERQRRQQQLEFEQRRANNAERRAAKQGAVPAAPFGMNADPRTHSASGKPRKSGKVRR